MEIPVIDMETKTASAWVDGQLLDEDLPIWDRPQPWYLRFGGNYDTVEDYDNIKIEVVDKTTQIPEFPTIALPVIAVIGLLFIFRRKN